MAVNPAIFMIPALMAAAEQKLLAPFRAAGATSPDRAIPLAIDESARDARLESLIRRGIIVEASPGRYYIDEGAIARNRQVNRPVLIGVILALVALAVLAVLAVLFF